MINIFKKVEETKKLKPSTGNFFKLSNGNFGNEKYNSHN